ncbi:MAG TPA: hypothetical protein VMN38_02395 [Sphingomicrobium sp.]|nr:hypothetical protein [Sphingomicrobium sp.]
MNERIASAVFDSRDEAERALSELRTAGISQSAISIVGRGDEDGGSTTLGGDTDGSDDEAKGDVVKGAAIGTGAGALLGIAALAIPGIGPLVAAGAIASTAIPAAAAIGAGAGLAAGSVAGLLSDHGVDEDDSRYFEESIQKGGYFVAVHADQAGPAFEQAREILFRNGGHSASRARMEATH